MNLPSLPRYSHVLCRIKDFYKEFDIKVLPVDTFFIIEKLGIKLVTYSDLEVFNEGNKINLDMLQYEEGFSLLINNTYLICYNDKTPCESQIPLILMREIGHIYLGHLNDFSETSISEELTNSQYEILNKEACAFARNTLSLAHEFVSE